MRALRRIGSVLVVLASCLALAGCSGASPNEPTPPAGGAPVVRNGTTEQPVAAQVDPPRPRSGDRISVTAGGFLTRQQLFEDLDIFLWPGDVNYVREIAYWEFDDGSLRTIRWVAPFTITLDDEIADDPAIVAKAREVAAEASRHIGMPVQVGPGGSVTIGVDPTLEDEDAVGEATVSFRGANIASARIVFWRRFEIAGGPQAQYSNTFLHELGHVIGLNHSPRTTDVMTPGEGPGTDESTYQPGEAATLHMSYFHRRPGNFFPDRDATLGAASTASGTFVITDRLNRSPR